MDVSPLYLEAEHLGVHQEEGVVDGQEAADPQDELAWGQGVESWVGIDYESFQCCLLFPNLFIYEAIGV